MDSIFTGVRDPRWLDDAQTTIELVVDYVDLGTRRVEVSSDADYVPAGIEIYDRAVAGHFGRVAPPQPLVGFEGFMALFTTTEQSRILASTNARVRMLMLTASAFAAVRLDDPRIVEGVSLLAELHLIAAARQPDILAGLPPPDT